MSMMRTDRKPPLARSPMRLRTRSASILRSATNIVQTPPGSLTKTKSPPNSPWGFNQSSDLRPEYHTISCEIRALAKMVENEFGSADLGKAAFGSSKSNSAVSISSPLFERGRFYDEYSARRNERLRRKTVGEETGSERKKKTAYDLGVKVESAKKRGDSKRLEGLRKSVFSTPVATTTAAAAADRRENPRYLLRSMTKENKKPPLPPMNFEKSVRRR